MKAVTWTSAARRQFRKCAEIAARLERFAQAGSGDLKRLAGRPGSRLRVGDYRVIFVETSEAVEVRVVGHRREIYR